MERREALKLMPFAPSAFAIACGKGPTEPSDEIEQTTPFYDPQIETATSITNDEGIAQLSTPSSALELTVENEFHQPLSSVRVSMLTTPQQRIVAAYDQDGNYLPSPLFLPNNVAKPALPRWLIQLYETTKNMTTGVISNLAIKYIPEPIINRSGHMIDLHRFKDNPFVTYEGDFSFNDVQELIKFTSLIFGSVSSLLGVPEDEATGKLAGVISLLRKGGITISGIPYILEEVVDAINDYTPFHIDKDKRYSFYRVGLPKSFSSFGGVSPLQFSFFLPTMEQESVFDIKYYLPTRPGNEWTFSSKEGRATITSLGMQRVNGRDLVVFESFFHKEYYGFIGDELRFFGFYSDDIGNILFNPPILIGDSGIRIGREYTTESSVSVEGHPEIKGSLTERIKYEGLEDKVVRAGAFGNCLRMKETVPNFTVRDTRTGETVSESAEATNWLARNVGKLKTEFVDTSYGEEYPHDYELFSASINGLSMPKTAQPNNLRVSSLVLPYLIRKAILNK